MLSLRDHAELNALSPFSRRSNTSQPAPLSVVKPCKSASSSVNNTSPNMISTPLPPSITSLPTSDNLSNGLVLANTTLRSFSLKIFTAEPSDDISSIRAKFLSDTAIPTAITSSLRACNNATSSEPSEPEISPRTVLTLPSITSPLSSRYLLGAPSVMKYVVVIAAPSKGSPLCNHSTASAKGAS